MSQWIKLHTAIINDPKMARLNWKDRGIWMMIMALAGQLERRDENDRLTGQLDTLDNVAWHLRTRVADIQPTIEKLIQLDMLHQDDDGILYVTHFADRQSADMSTERVRRYRERGKLGAPAWRNHHPDETPMKRDETPMKRDETPMKRDETPMKRDETEQNRTESEQNQNQNQNQTTTESEQSKTDAEHSFVVAVVNQFVDKAVKTVDNSVDMSVDVVDVVDSTAEKPHDGATDDFPDELSEGERSPGDGVDGGGDGAERVRGMIRRVAAARSAERAPPAGQLAADDAERAQARAQLLALGVDAAMAEQLARAHPPERVQGWCAYARQQTRLSNPAGFVVNRLAHGLSPPQEAGAAPRWYSEEEYARFFYRGASSDEPAVLPAEEEADGG